MAHTNEPRNPTEPEPLDAWVEQTMRERPLRADSERAMPDPQLIQELQHLYQAEAQAVDRRLERVRQRLERRALTQQSRQGPTPRALPVVPQRREYSPMPNPIAHLHPPKSWPARLGALAAAVLIVGMVGVLVAGIILVRHPVGSQTGHSSNSSPSSVTPTTPAGNLVPALYNLTMLDIQHGWALDNPEYVAQTTTGITTTESNQYLILTTSDGGSHWQNVTPKIQSGQVITPDFVTASTAWLFVGTNQLFVTTNGGQTWQARKAPGGSYNELDRLTFLNAEDGWLILSNATDSSSIALFGTTDGGNTWVKLQSTSNSQSGQLPLAHFQQITFLTAQDGWAAGENAASTGSVQLYVTHDGGATWQQQRIPLPAQGFSGPTVDTRAPEFFNAQDGILEVTSSTATPQAQVANRPQSGILGGVIYVTHDGGATWQAGALLPIPPGFISFSDADHGWLASSDNADLWATSDGGAHWTKLSVGGLIAYAGGGGNALSYLDFVSSQIGFAERDDLLHGTQLVQTQDSGHTWTQINFHISN